jgi:hypothetical protein
MTGDDIVTRMGEAAANLLAALGPDQRRRACFGFPAPDERTRWYYTPKPRSGLPLAEMDPGQQRLVFALLAAGLSRVGYATAATILGLERVLDRHEGFRRADPGRSPLLYYVSVFGRPDPRAPWGFRFEGHHVSLNYTIAEGRLVSPTPTFFGANPAETSLGGAASLRPLGGIEDTARELLHALDEDRRRIAVISPAAPTDVVTSNRPRVVEGALPLTIPEMHGQTPSDEDLRRIAAQRRALGLTEDRLDALRYTRAPKGLAASAMSAGEREILIALVRQYVGRMPDDVAEAELRALEARGVDELTFAWAGGAERGEPHYYRLQGPRFLVEYDNTQDGANHAHSVWRDPEGDFGGDLLAQHYAEAHS